MTSPTGSISYTIQECRLVLNASGYRYLESEHVFEVSLGVENVQYTYRTSFKNMLESLKMHAPQEFAYIKRLEEDLDDLSENDGLLMEALEAEDYDFLKLLYFYLDHLPAEDFFDDATKEEKLPELVIIVTSGLENPENKDKPAEKVKWGGINRLIFCEIFTNFLYQDAKQLFFRTFRRLNTYDKAQLTGIRNLIFHYSDAVARRIAMLVWVAEEYEKPEEWLEEILKGYEPENRRIKLREKPLFEKDNPPISVEILDYENEWNTLGSNTVNIWFRITAEDGIGYWHADFSHVRTEALLQFPQLYRRIEELESSIEAIHPKEPQVVEALLKEGWDLTPALQAYSQLNTPVKIALMMYRIGAEKGKFIDDYHQYLEGKGTQTPDNHCRWRQTCHIIEDALIKSWMAILHEHSPVLFETTDHRIRDFAVEELKVNLSNLLYDVREEFTELYEGEVDW